MCKNILMVHCSDKKPVRFLRNDERNVKSQITHGFLKIVALEGKVFLVKKSLHMESIYDGTRKCK